MVVQIHFKNFEPDENVKSGLGAALSRVADLSPSGARVAALIEKQDESYRCSMDIYSRSGPLMASAVRGSALEAILAVEEKMVRAEGYGKRRGTLQENENYFEAVS